MKWSGFAVISIAVATVGVAIGSSFSLIKTAKHECIDFKVGSLVKHKLLDAEYIVLTANDWNPFEQTCVMTVRSKNGRAMTMYESELTPITSVTP